MPEINSLVLNVKSNSVEKGADRLDHLTRSATKAGISQKGLATSSNAVAPAMGKAATATKAFRTTLISALGPLLALVSAGVALKKIFSTTVGLQDFNAN